MNKTLNCSLLSIFLIVVFVTVGYAKAADTAPDFTLKDLTGQSVKLGNYKGKPVLLVFVTTWCPACRAELPRMTAIYNQYKDKGLIMFNINIMESPEKVSSFVTKRGIPIPVLVDPDGHVAESYGVVGVPTKVLIDAQGKVVCWECRTLEEKLSQIIP